MYHAHVTVLCDEKNIPAWREWAKGYDLKVLHFAMPSFSKPSSWHFEVQVASDKYSADYICDLIHRSSLNTSILRVKEEVDFYNGDKYDAKYYEAHFRLSKVEYEKLMRGLPKDCPDFLFPSLNMDNNNVYLTCFDTDFDLFKRKYDGTSKFLTSLELPVFSHAELVKADTDMLYTHGRSADIREHSTWDF